ncbi:MAG: hypothetical protein WEA09_14245 [Gemmatimonadota bacterium]
MKRRKLPAMLEGCDTQSGELGGHRDGHSGMWHPPTGAGTVSHAGAGAVGIGLLRYGFLRMTSRMSVSMSPMRRSIQPWPRVMVPGGRRIMAGRERLVVRTVVEGQGVGGKCA